MTETNTKSKLVSWRVIGATVGVLLILVLLLLLDLRFHGLAWQFMWSKTGEEEPVGQVLGTLQWLGNFTRRQPEIQPLVPITHTDASPYSINTFLHQEAEEAKRHEQLRMITEAGFTWIREEFPWEDLEVDGRGQFTDSRNDYTRDGIPDTISSWLKYDNVVDLAEQYGVEMLVRLSNPPSWTHSNPDIGDKAPPDDFDDFVNYAVAVAERYRGRIHYYQVWNEPNIYPEWGNQSPDPIAYTDLLCRTYRALKAVDPEIVIVSGAIAPTHALGGVNYQDLVYLTNMYEAGAGDCFDILAAQGYGLFSGPTDERLRFNQFGYQRHIYYRDIMVQYGDSHKPIWLSEAAWNPVLDADLPPDQIAGFSNYGEVTEEQAARYMPIAYQRAQQEWSWVGQVSYWFFTRPSNIEVNQAYYYFRMVEPDYSAEHPTFTPLPVYDAMQDYISEATQLPTLYIGTHQAESWEVTAENGQTVTVDAAQFETAIESNNVYFSAEGTDIRVRIQTDHTVQVVRDGTFYETPITARDGWQTVTIYDTLLRKNHHFTLEGEQSFIVDSITVSDNTAKNISIPTALVLAIGLIAIIQIARAALNRY
jgi:polysaccharide biosynthesis protein PslG